MGDKLTFTGKIRSHGGRGRSTVPGVGVHSVLFHFTPDGTNQVQCRVGRSTDPGPLLVLPSRSIILLVAVISPQTGGTSPTVDLGSASAPTLFYDNLPIDDVSDFINLNGTFNSTARLTGGLSGDTAVYGRGGTGTLGTGTPHFMFLYTFLDNGKAD